MDQNRLKRAAAEGMGTLLLVATVVGSGIMAERLAAGNVAVALLANTLATVFGLSALILMFGGVSGSHFNPIVTMVEVMDKRIPRAEAPGYVVAQVCGGLAGAILANVLFSQPAIAFSAHERSGPLMGLSEFVATFGLVAAIRGVALTAPPAVPLAVPAWIGAAYWFTPSTSFANPAVTLARALTDTFAGIRPADVPLFLLAQVLGAASASLAFRWLSPQSGDPK